MTAPEEIISDAEIIRVHAYANFGSMTPRQVVNDGVRKYAVGFTGGSTQVAILREHGLIKKPKGCGYKADLTEKGKRYARAIWSDADLHDATKAQLAECEARLHKAMEALRHCCEDIEKGWLAIPDIEEKFNTDNSWHAVQHAHAVMAEVEKGEKK